jgi:hypothetical protein
MIFSSEDLICLTLQLLRRCVGQIMKRLALFLVDKQARSVQVHLDLFEAEHFLDSLIVKHDIILALPFEVANLGVLNALHVV